MLKKILYIVASFLLGFMIILYVVNSSFYTAFAKINAEAVSNKDYEKAERFFSRVYDQNKFYVGDIENDDKTTTHIEIYSALNDGIRYHNVLNEQGEVVEKKEYYTLESSIQVSIFHVPAEFSTTDVYNGEEVVSRGGVAFVFGDKTVLFPFSGENFDYYSLQSSFAFLALSISEYEYYNSLEAVGIAADSVVDSVLIYDGAGDLEYTINFETGKNPTFDNKFHDTFEEVITQYNALQLESAKGNTPSDEEVSAMEEKYFSVANESGYQVQHSTKIIYGSSKFIVRVVVAAVIYTGIVVLIGWLIFRKKKTPKYVPPGFRNRMQQQNKKPVQQREPEQFSREVFDLDKDDVVEKTNTPEGE